MPKAKGRYGTTGRVTTSRAKVEKADKAVDRDAAPRTSGRYTPPVPQQFKESARWVPILMFTFLTLGTLLIIVNYTPLWPWQSNWYLLLGLGLITLGFITATKWQ